MANLEFSGYYGGWIDPSIKPKTSAVYFMLSERTKFMLEKEIKTLRNEISSIREKIKLINPECFKKKIFPVKRKKREESEVDFQD